MSNRVERIIRLFGSQATIAEKIGRGQSTVSDWCKNARVPSQRIPEIIAAAARLDPPVTLTPADFFDIPNSHQPASTPMGMEAAS